MTNRTLLFHFLIAKGKGKKKIKVKAEVEKKNNKRYVCGGRAAKRLLFTGGLLACWPVSRKACRLLPIQTTESSCLP
jgi:hypothetical protein